MQTLFVDEEIWYWRVNNHRTVDTVGVRKGKRNLEYNQVQIRKHIDAQLRILAKRGIKPKIRKLYYILSNLGGEGRVLPSIKKGYHWLSRYMTKVRENGDLPMDCVIDDRHRIIDINDIYISSENGQNTTQVNLEIGRDYHDENEIDQKFPKWFGQKNYVEIWTEKEAMTSEFDKIVDNEDLQARIVPYGGNAGTTFLNDCVIRLKKKMNLRKNIHILYYGDFDPSGEMMDGYNKQTNQCKSLKNEGICRKQRTYV